MPCSTFYNLRISTLLVGTKLVVVVFQKNPVLLLSRDWSLRGGHEEMALVQLTTGQLSAGEAGQNFLRSVSIKQANNR